MSVTSPQENAHFYTSPQPGGQTAALAGYREHSGCFDTTALAGYQEHSGCFDTAALAGYQEHLGCNSAKL